MGHHSKHLRSQTVNTTPEKYMPNTAVILPQRDNFDRQPKTFDTGYYACSKFQPCPQISKNGGFLTPNFVFLNEKFSNKNNFPRD